ncbi:hypothetical protein PUN4_340158 [Paraburkholderia unamae]|nr:hypothetical protein PUN4_340158 [Paraburkholderia unamae]
MKWLDRCGPRGASMSFSNQSAAKESFVLPVSHFDNFHQSQPSEGSGETSHANVQWRQTR